MDTALLLPTLETFLKANNATLVIPLLPRLRLSGTRIYLPDDVAIRFLAKHVNVPVECIFDSVKFIEMLQYGNNPNGFSFSLDPKGRETIDGLAILASMKMGHKTYKIIDGILAKDDDVKQLLDDDDVRNTIRHFIQENANSGIRITVLKNKEKLDKTISELVQYGTTPDEINQRVERSNRIFDEEIFVMYTYSLRPRKPKLASEFRGRRENDEILRAGYAARLEQYKLDYEKGLIELGVQSISQKEIIDMLYQRSQDFQIPKSSTTKVLLVCVSYDEIRIRKLCINIVRNFKPDTNIEIEFYCVNPEKYGPSRINHQIWIDRDHYFEMPFGEKVDPSEHPDIDRLIQSGPYDFIIYAHCPIYSEARKQRGTGRDINIEGQELNSIMRPDSVLVIYPFDKIPVQTSLAFKSVGIDIVGKMDLVDVGDTFKSIGVYIKKI